MATAGQLAEVISSLADIKKNMADFRQEVKQELAMMKAAIKKEIQGEIRALRQEMDVQLQKVSKEMEDRREEIAEVQRRVAETGAWRSETDKALTKLEERVSGLHDKLLDLQSRQMRNEIRVFNCPETAEDGQTMVEFMEQLFWAELDLPEKTELKITRAYRAPTRAPQDASAPPRAIVINFNNFDIKEMVLRLAWRKEIKVAGKRLGFEHNFPPEVVQKRKQYTPLKRLLKQEGVSFQSPYTKLRVHWEDGTKVYESAAQAAREIQEKFHKKKTPAKTRGLDSPTGDVETAPVPIDEEEKEKRRKEAVAKWQRVLRKKTGENRGAAKKDKEKGQGQSKKS